MSTGQLPVETLKYLKEKNVEALMEHLMHELLLSMPVDPLSFLSGLLERSPVPKIVMSGPPASGKGTQCELIVQRYDVVHISTGVLLRSEIEKQTAIGQQAKGFVDAGQLVPDQVITSLVKNRLARDDVQRKGWILDGFPRTRSQALEMQICGIIPNVFLALDVEDEVVKLRISGRRTDPQNGAVYHTTYNPPPEGLAVVQRSDDTLKAIGAKLTLYHRNLDAVVSCYTAIAVHIDANRDKLDVFEEIHQQIDARVPKC